MKLGNSRYFTAIDLASGFHQIQVKTEDQPKIAFSTHQGHFKFSRMPFGLKNAPATFQTVINQVLAEYIDTICFAYLDDKIIFSSMFLSHLDHLTKILTSLQKNGLKIQLDKTEFLKTEIEYLGHIITPEGIKPNQKKLDALRNMKAPTNIKEIQIFLGMSGYYRKFIENYFALTKPITALLKKEKTFEWTSECQNAFEIIITKLTSQPMLTHRDFEKKFYLTTDVSHYAIGSVLTQKNNKNEYEPIGYASRALLKSEINYSTIEKGLLAIV